MQSDTVSRGHVVQAMPLTDVELKASAALKKRIDIHIMPLVILIFLLSYIDRYDTIFTSPSCIEQLSTVLICIQGQSCFRKTSGTRERSRSR